MSGGYPMDLVNLLAGEDQQFDRFWGGGKFNSVYISTATTTLVKSGAGVLRLVSIGETAAGSITLYNALTATGTPIHVLKANIAEGTYQFDVVFSVGLTIVTAAASKLMVSYL